MKTGILFAITALVEILEERGLIRQVEVLQRVKLIRDRKPN
ncbi:MAG TPA: hypothetical protein VKV95_14525 [Terriglobia bacterium]|nr:hypothetical protein [Terriglobia bacterium]